MRVSRGLDNDLMCGMPKTLKRKEIANNGGGQIIKNEHRKFDRRRNRKLVCIYSEGSDSLVNPVVCGGERDGELGCLWHACHKLIDAHFNSADAGVSFEITFEGRP